MATDWEAVPEEFLASPQRYFTEYVPQALANRGDLSSKIGDTNAIAQIELAGDDGGQWHFLVAEGAVEVGQGAHDAPDFTVNMAVDTWRKLRRGEVNSQAAFLTGQLKIAGNMGLAMKLGPLFR